MSPRVSARLLATLPDRRLAELARAGHERAFEAVVHRYRPPLLRYCARIGLSRTRSEDALQQALMQAWLALERGQEVRELRPWLYRIVHNTALDQIGRQREDHAPLRDAAGLACTVRGEAEIDQRIELSHTLAHVAALPALQREAILLSAVDGCSHAEVASALGVSDGGVRGLIYRARATLRAAAAALMPPPLLAWACGSAGTPSPAAERLIALSGPAAGAAGAAGLGGAALKGAAVAVSAAVIVAGAAIAPPRHHARARTRAGQTPAGLAPSARGAEAQRERASFLAAGTSVSGARTGVGTNGFVHERGGARALPPPRGRGLAQSTGSSSDGETGRGERGESGARDGSAGSSRVLAQSTRGDSGAEGGREVAGAEAAPHTHSGTDGSSPAAQAVNDGEASSPGRDGGERSAEAAGATESSASVAAALEAPPGEAPASGD